MAGLFVFNIMFLSSFDSSWRSKSQDGAIANEASKKITTIDDVLKGLVEWLCAQVCISCII